MEPKTSIKQHDFISGEPRNKYFVFGDYDFSDIRIMPSTNPCGEISLGGFQRGELGVVMAPAGVGKTGMMNRLMESMREQEELRESIEAMREMTDNERFAHKITLNSIY